MILPPAPDRCRFARGRHASAGGFSLISVLVVTGGALLVATSLLFVAQAEVAGTARTAQAARSRALAWSGVKAVMSRLHEQRELILEGRRLQLDERYVIYEAGSRQGVVSLLPVGPEGERLVPEAGRLDVNRVDADMLAATGMIDEPQGRSVIAHRDEELRRPYQSVGELLQVPGLSAETLYGPLEELAVADDVATEPDRVEPPSASPEIADAPRGLADVVTVYAIEPALQQSGKLRINLNVEWSDELGRRVERRFGRDAAETLRRIMESGTTFDSEAKIFEVLRFFDVPPEDWPEIVDAFTTDDSGYHVGRLDINTAPYEALVALPGLEPEQAAEIVGMRDELSPDQRSTIAWPAVQGIVEPEAYDELASWITTRSWSYRIRLSAGEVDVDTPDAPPAPTAIFEAVIDLSAPRPRVAYLRDITLLTTTAALAVNASLDRVESSLEPGLDRRESPDRAEAASAGTGGQDDLWEEQEGELLDEQPMMEAAGGGRETSRVEERVSPAPAPSATSSASEASEGKRRVGRWIGGR
ncbi:MAG: hypothetical protein ACYS0G_10020 [Planctomycetota bacterium]|jgi:DNA uptake protein ComE-like DNA-binding protein